MLKAKLNAVGGGSIELSLPTNLKEWKLTDKIAFDNSQRLIADYIAEEKEDSAKFILLLIDAVCEGLGIETKELDKLNVAELLDIDILSKLDNSFQDSIVSIYNYLRNLSEGYKFAFKTTDNFEFTYKGRKFTIPHLVAKSVLGYQFSEFTVSQAVEIMTVKDYLRKVNADDDEFKNKEFTSLLKIVALTVREKGKGVPSSVSELDKRVSEKMILFQDINTQLAYDIIFFLISFMNILVPDKNINTSLIHPLVK